ncbi:MAG: GNAT family N-acetyltransferase [Devosia sp.]
MPSRALRPALPADLPALVALDTVAASDRQRRADISNWLAQGWLFVAERDDKIAGYGVLHNHFFGRSFLQLVMVAIASRRQGVATELLSHALQLCRSAQLWTSTNQSNLAMQALLAQSGFVRSGIIDNLDPGDPELIFCATVSR